VGACAFFTLLVSVTTPVQSDLLLCKYVLLAPYPPLVTVRVCIAQVVVGRYQYAPRARPNRTVWLRLASIPAALTMGKSIGAGGRSGGGEASVATMTTRVSLAQIPNRLEDAVEHPIPMGTVNTFHSCIYLSDLLCMTCHCSHCLWVINTTNLQLILCAGRLRCRV
jgi:hypothetical protein